MTFAYDAPASLRADLTPNLREAAEQPWMGLTAYIGNRPHLIIGKIGNSFILEDEHGQKLEVDYTFPWEEPQVETNRLVAASRMDESPFKGAGLLTYDDENGEWAIRVGISNMRYPLEEHVAALEANEWKLAAPIVDDDKDVTVNVAGRCPNCGSDTISWAKDEDEDTYNLEPDGIDTTSSADDPVVLCHSCHQWCHQSELDTVGDDADEKRNNKSRPEPEEAKESSTKLAAEGWSFQGFVAGAGRTEGVALNADKQTMDDMLATVGTLPSGFQQEKEYVRQKWLEHGQPNKPYRFDNPWVNRGGSVQKEAILPPDADPSYLPGFHSPEPTSYHFPGAGFILCKKWLTPADTIAFTGPSGRGIDQRFKGIITSEGGTNSHAVVVARGSNIQCIITDRENVDRINPGDHVEISETGVVNVNGGDPAFVAQDPGSISVRTALYRFVWAGGVPKVAEIDPNDINKVGTGHGDMLGEHMAEGSLQMSDDYTSHNAVAGYINSDGSVVEDSNQIPDQEAFEHWATEFRNSVGLPIGPIERTDVAGYVPQFGEQTAVAKVAAVGEMPYPGGQGIHNGTSAAFTQAGITATVHLPHGPSLPLPFSNPMMFIMVKKWQMQDYPAATGGASPVGAPIQVDSENLPLAMEIINSQSGATAATDRPSEALTCPKCGSHTIEATHKDEDKGSANCVCHTCGNSFKSQYRVASAELAKGQRIVMTHPAKKGIRGSIAEHTGTDENFGDHLYNLLLDNGDELKKVPETHFTIIKSASLEEPPQWFVEELQQNLEETLLRESGMQKGYVMEEYDYKVIERVGKELGYL